MIYSYKRNKTLLISSYTLTKFAETIFYLSIIWYIYEITNSSIATAFYSIISILSSTFIGPLVGVFAERRPAKTIMEYCFIIIGVLGLLLSLLFYLEISYLIICIYIFTFIHTVLTLTSNISRGRLMGQIIPREKIPQVAGLFSSFGSIADMIGNAAAGFLLLLIGYSGIIVLQSGSYLLSILLIFWIVINTVDKKENVQQVPVKPNFFKELIEGVNEFKKNRPLFKLIIIASMINILSIGSALIVVLIQEHFHAGAKEYGLFHAAGSFSIILIGLLASKYLKITRPGILFASCLFAVGIPMILISITTDFWVGTLLFMIIVGAEVMMMISINSLLILLVEENFRARVMSLAMAVSNLFMPLGILFNAILADFLDIKYAFLICGIWVLIWATIAVLSKDIRNLVFTNSANESTVVES